MIKQNTLQSYPETCNLKYVDEQYSGDEDVINGEMLDSGSCYLCLYINNRSKRGMQSVIFKRLHSGAMNNNILLFFTVQYV